MGVRTVFELEGLDDVLKQLDDIGEGLSDVRDLLDEAAAITLSRIRDRFLHEMDPDGTPWVPSRAGIARRGKGGTGTLFDTGTLFRSIQLFASTDTERTIGTNVNYAKKIQLGGWYAFDNPKGNLQPARVFLGFGDEDVFLVEALVQRRFKTLTEG